MHIPVLKEEVLHFLNPKENENFIDCTAGFGGHSLSILEKNGPEGKVLGFEWDEDVYNTLKEKESERFIVVNESYTQIEEVVEEKKFSKVSGVLFDLGFSSFHVDKSQRGFSFMREEKLDMRYNENNPLTAYEIVNKYKEKDILHILEKWGEEDYAREIVEKIIFKRKERPIETTTQLAKIVESSIPKHYKDRKKINPATKTFQALRIAVNGELLGLTATLPLAYDVLERGGRMVIICFHGGEEKIVKNFFRSSNISNLTPKPIIPKKEEVIKNIRSRSAKLFAAIKK
jgi:16S rRNA (cytosine1402-N4)-methyltransferase